MLPSSPQATTVHGVDSNQLQNNSSLANNATFRNSTLSTSSTLGSQSTRLSISSHLKKKSKSLLDALKSPHPPSASPPSATSYQVKADYLLFRKSLQKKIAKKLMPIIKIWKNTYNVIFRTLNMEEFIPL
ncbi:hypothetical protein BDC45DRAFT_559613 [Circinella umbellata]|nr:hypothetical protein BDC45DRAFT_559613 [Circinella umbellata]